MRLFLAAVALAAAAFLAACSGQDSSSEKPDQAATIEEKTTEAAPDETIVEQTTEVTTEAIADENAALELASVENELASPIPPPPSKAQDSLPSSPDWRTPSQKAGFTEGGQDVSNTAVISPEENARRLPCLRADYESLPPNQRGPESQRVTAEANAQGVTPYDIVGC